MPKPMWPMSLASVLTLGVACTTVQIPQATEIDVKRAALRRPRTTLADLERGRTLYLSRCTSCHRPIEPMGFRAQEWPGYVAEMQERARLGQDEAELVVLYLVTMAAQRSEQASEAGRR